MWQGATTRAVVSPHRLCDPPHRPPHRPPHPRGPVQNVDYCSGQTLPNCKGWLLYNVTAPPAFPAPLTPQRGFSAWYAAVTAAWPQLAVERAAWHARVQASLPGGPAAYPRRATADAAAARAAAARVAIIDPLVWPANTACPYGT